VNTEPNIKYRVTGALVLIALAVIFLPLLLDGQKKNQILESNIPDKPVTGEIILINIADTEKANEQLKNNSEQSNDETAEQIESQIVKEVIVKSTNEAKTSANKSIKTTEKKPVVKPPVTKPLVTKSLDTKPLEKTQIARADRPQYKSSAFVIQIGSFSNKDSAQKIVDNLKAAHYKAYLKHGMSNGESINRVLVGPELKRENAESQLSAINKISGLKAIILSYDPLRH
jgi:DedD protein